MPFVHTAELVGDDDRVVVRSIGPIFLEGQQEEFGGRCWVEVPRIALWQTLERLKDAGHTLVEVKPTLSLETAFMKVVSRQ